MWSTSNDDSRLSLLNVPVNVGVGTSLSMSVSIRNLGLAVSNQWALNSRSSSSMSTS